jgi:hypothetical protein
LKAWFGVQAIEGWVGTHPNHEKTSITGGLFQPPKREPLLPKPGVNSRKYVRLDVALIPGSLLKDLLQIAFPSGVREGILQCENLCRFTCRSSLFFQTFTDWWRNPIRGSVWFVQILSAPRHATPHNPTTRQRVGLGCVALWVEESI